MTPAFVSVDGVEFQAPSTQCVPGSCGNDERHHDAPQASG
jgi:hypothetical protein